MSDFGMFESDEATQAQPRLAAKTAARKLDAAIDTVRAEYGRFLVAATGIDEFEDRWHLSKADIRASVEPLVFPNTGTMRRIKNALKQDWKLAHPYKVGLSHGEAGFGSMPEGDHDHRNQNLKKTYHPSDDNLIPEGNFEGYKDSVDQGGPEKVQRDFTPGGDSGSDRHARRKTANPTKDFAQHLMAQGIDPNSLLDDQETLNDHLADYINGHPDFSDEAAIDHYHQIAERLSSHGFDDDLPPRPGPENAYGHGDVRNASREAAALVADIYTDFAQSNGLRVASLDTLAAYADTGIAEADYRLLESMIVATAADDCDCDDDDTDDTDDDSDSEDAPAKKAPPSFGDDSDDDSDEDSDESDSDDDHEEPDADNFGGPSDGDEDNEDDESAGGQQFTVPDQAPDLDPQVLNEIPHDDTDGTAPVPPSVVDSLLGLPEGTIEQLLLEEVEQGQGGSPEAGGDDFFGEGGGDEQGPPPRVGRRRTASLHDETEFGQPFSIDERGQVGPSEHYGPEAGYLQLDHDGQSLDDNIEGLDDWQPLSGFTGQYGYHGPVMHPSEYLGGGLEKHIRSNPGHYVTFPIEGMRPGQDESESVGWGVAYKPHGDEGRTAARQFWAAPDESEDELTERQKRDQKTSLDTQHERWLKEKSARLFWAADDDQQPAGDGGPQAPADPAAAGGDPAAMGGAPMMPPPGAGAVAPPAAPAPLENQPAEDQLLDMASQAITQMIDRETAEYQQIIDPLTQALQAVQFAQQVESAEHPLDVTPPQGTVNVDPSQAPAAQANPMQQQASRRRASGDDPYAESYGDITGGPSIDDPTDGPTYQRVHPDIEKALRRRFDGGGSSGWHPDKPGVILHGLGNWWDGPSEVKHLGGGDLEYTNPYNGQADRFRAEGYYDDQGNIKPWSREAKRNDIIRKAAYVIADRYGLSEHGYRAIVAAALGRRDYEHIIEAVRLAHPDDRQKIASHLAHLFKAGNSRFNADVFMKTVMASKPRDRAGDAWRDGRDRGVAEHGRQDAEDYGDEGPLVSSSEPWQGFGDQGHPRSSSVPWSERHRIRDAASRGRRPFDRPRLAGETWKNMPVPDAFEFENDQPKSSDNMTINDLPKMKGAGLTVLSKGVAERFQKWQQTQAEKGLNFGGDVDVENFITQRSLSPGGQAKLHSELGIAHPPTKSPAKMPKPTVPKAKNPVTKRGTWGEWEPTREASFFTRKVPGWKWDDHLNGYLSKEGKAFTCSCGQKVAAPSYKTCDCGKVWNVYAIGDTHHLASDSAEMFIAREIPVREGVIMANRKMAGDGMSYEDTMRHIDEQLARGPQHEDPYASPEVECRYCDGPATHGVEDMSGRKFPVCEGCLDSELGGDDGVESWPIDSHRSAAPRADDSQRELLAMIDKLADWTKYDDEVDPVVEAYGKDKIPSTKAPKIPRDWSKREPNGTWKNTNFAPKKK